MLPEQTSVEATRSIDTIRKIEEDVDLLTYVYAVFDAKWFIFFIALICAGLSLLYAKSLPETYQGVVRVDIIDISDAGGIKPDSRLVPESIGLLEHGFVLRTRKDNYNQKILAYLRSRQYVRHFLDTYNIYKTIYAEHWSEEDPGWIGDFELDKGLAQKTFTADLLAIDYSIETDIVAVKIIHSDPVLAAQLANQYVQLFNEYMRDETLAKVQVKARYLQETLAQTKAIEIQQMLFRLMEAQTAKAMLANGRQEYILEVLDPAVRPYARFKPNRKQITILGGIAGALLAISLVISLEIAGKVAAALREYAIETQRQEVSQRRWSLRAWVLMLVAAIGSIFRRRGSRESR
jgi:LPS O-antigen subunit length determinant protein (WzzB/FepE family)